MSERTCNTCGLVKDEGEFWTRTKCKACNNVYMRAYYQKNRAKHIAWVKAYAERNPPDPERQRASARARYALRKATGEPCSIEGCGRPRRNKTSKICAAHDARHRQTGILGGEIRSRVARAMPAGTSCSRPGCTEPYEAAGLCKRHYRAKHHRDNPEIAAMADRRRRALKEGLPSEPYAVADILARDGAGCVLCGEPLDLEAVHPDPFSVSVEHLEPLSWRTAGDTLDNVAAAHLRCNLSRHNRPHPRAAAKRAELVRAQSADMAG